MLYNILFKAFDGVAVENQEYSSIVHAIDCNVHTSNYWRLELFGLSRDIKNYLVTGELVHSKWVIEGHASVITGERGVLYVTAHVFVECNSYLVSGYYAAWRKPLAWYAD